MLQWSIYSTEEGHSTHYVHDSYQVLIFCHFHRSILCPSLSGACVNTVLPPSPPELHFRFQAPTGWKMSSILSISLPPYVSKVLSSNKHFCWGERFPPISTIHGPFYFVYLYQVSAQVSPLPNKQTQPPRLSSWVKHSTQGNIQVNIHCILFGFHHLPLTPCALWLVSQI